MVASIIAYSMSGSSLKASNIRLNTSGLNPSTKPPERGCSSCRTLAAGRATAHPVRTTQSTASRNNRVSRPVRPGAVELPGHSGSIAQPLAVCKNKSARVHSNLLFWKVESELKPNGNPECPQTLSHAAAQRENLPFANIAAKNLAATHRSRDFATVRFRKLDDCCARFASVEKAQWAANANSRHGRTN